MPVGTVAEELSAAAGCAKASVAQTGVKSAPSLKGHNSWTQDRAPLVQDSRLKVLSTRFHDIQHYMISTAQHTPTHPDAVSANFKDIGLGHNISQD